MKFFFVLAEIKIGAQLHIMMMIVLLLFLQKQNLANYLEQTRPSGGTRPALGRAWHTTRLLTVSPSCTSGAHSKCRL
jgi:hypothetical protein